MLRKLIIYVNLLFALLLLLAGWSIYVNPTKIWTPAFLGLGYPFLLLANLFFIFLALFFFKKKQLMLISLVAIALTWSSFRGVFNISASARTLDDVSILTWNVKNFDLYNWSQNEETREHMMQFLEKENPDILCLQEFYTENKGAFKNIKELKRRLGYKYVYFAETFSIKKGTKKWGLATFSKFPIKNKGKIIFDNQAKLNACIYTDIEYQKDSVFRIYNTHLQSLHFADEDYQFLNDLKEEQKANVEGSKKIVRKLKNGFQKRAKQARKIKTHAKEFGEKKIICGDFNDTPTSYAYHVLSQDLQDAFIAKGTGFGGTWINPSPFFRIDFLLASKSITINSYETFSKKYSDHYPVKVYLDLK